MQEYLIRKVVLLWHFCTMIFISYDRHCEYRYRQYPTSSFSNLLAIWLLTSQFCICLFEGLLWPLEPAFSAWEEGHICQKINVLVVAPKKIVGKSLCISTPAPLPLSTVMMNCQFHAGSQSLSSRCFLCSWFNMCPLLTPPLFGVWLSYPPGNVSFQGSKLYTLEPLC